MTWKRKNIEAMTTEELEKELAFMKECLLDEEEMHGFSMSGTSVHIGAKEAKRMQDEHEEKCAEYRERISNIESFLKKKKKKLQP